MTAVPMILVSSRVTVFRGSGVGLAASPVLKDGGDHNPARSAKGHP